MDLSGRLTGLADGVVGLRRWRLDDLACLRAASDEGRIPEGTTVPAVWSDAAGQEFVERQWGRATSGEGWSFAVVRAGDDPTVDRAVDRAVGCVVLMLRPQEGVAGIGYWLEPQARGRGTAARAVALLSRWALEDGGLARVEAWVEPSNVASARVLTRCGFRQEGRLRSFLRLPGRRADALVFSLLPSDVL